MCGKDCPCGQTGFRARRSARLGDGCGCATELEINNHPFAFEAEPSEFDLTAGELESDEWEAEEEGNEFEADLYGEMSEELRRRRAPAALRRRVRNRRFGKPRRPRRVFRRFPKWPFRFPIPWPGLVVAGQPPVEKPPAPERPSGGAPQPTAEPPADDEPPTAGDEPPLGDEPTADGEPASGDEPTSTVEQPAGNGEVWNAKGRIAAGFYPQRRSRMMNRQFVFQSEPFELELEYEAQKVPTARKPAPVARQSAPMTRKAAPTARAASSTARKYPPFSLEPILRRALGQAKPKQELEFFGDFSEFEEELTGARLTAAVAANRRLARQLGWGCIVANKLQLNEAPRPRLYDLLGLGARASEEDFAKAVEQFQVKEMKQRTGDGQLGPGAWKELLRRNVLPANKFAPFSKAITFGGRKLGVLEKTSAYEKCFFDPATDSACRAARSGIANEGAGAMIELGFRVTDIDAVRRAGFVDGYGEPFFRWIQIVEFITRPVLTPAGALTGFVRRASGEIDPMEVVGIPAEELDLHPYYWDEETLGRASAGLNIDHWIHRRGQNGLCYDLVFMDRATFPLITVSPPAPWTRPGSHAYFNFELALVGVRPGEKIQNFVLYTVKWGYDIFMKGGQPTVDLNGLHPGPTNGSATFKKIMNREFKRDAFPGHCMAGSGYTGKANCAHKVFADVTLRGGRKR